MQLQKPFALTLILLLFLSISCNSDSLVGSFSDVPCEDTNCADYNSQAEAQRDYDWDPECRGDLDADNDGIACEENHWVDYYSSLNNGGSGGGSGTTGCPTTANCGCSNKRKAECENDRCCQWIVGTGCKCK